jgi:sialidase-1
MSILRLVLIMMLCVPMAQAAELVKEQDVVIYQDDHFYSAFPSIVKLPKGELLCAFRRAPDRRAYGEKGNSHTDPNSYLVLVRSTDNGLTWSKQPELIFAHPYGGSQDPCMIRLRDGSILCASYGWARVNDDARAENPKMATAGEFLFLGGYIMRSTDDGNSWQGPIIPPPTPGCPREGLFHTPLPSYNRGAMIQGKDGKVYWAVATHSEMEGRTEIHLMVSEDGGVTWEYSGPMAQDKKVVFNETSLYETPGGDLVAFVRTAGFDDHTVIVRSKDHGKTWAPWEDAGFQGHPHFALSLPDDKVFLIYGYRHKPFGIRARVLNAECTDFATAEEIVLREDGGGGDLGYPWATMTEDGKVLAVYYFNKANGTRHIAGSLLSYK